MGTLPTSLDALTAFTNAVDLMSDGQTDRAIESWMRAATLDSTYMQPRLHAAAALQGLHPAAADSVLIPVERRRAVLAPGDRAMLDYDLSAIRGKPDAMFEAAEAFLRAEPGADLPYFFMEGAAVAMNRPERAIEAGTHIDSAGRFRLAGASALHYNFLTRAYHQLGRFALELEQARAGRARNPTSVAMAALEARALAALDSVRKLDRIIDEIEGAMTPWEEWTTASALLDVAGELEYHGGTREAVVGVITRALKATEFRDSSSATAEASAFDRARCLYQLGRYRDAASLLATLARGPSTDVQHPVYLSYQAAAAARLGRTTLTDHLARQLDSLRGRPYDRGVTPYAQAQLAAQRGDTAAALAFLAQAFRDGITLLPTTSLHADRMLTPLRGNARFEDLARRGVAGLEGIR
jgi:hypothetical protein